MVFAETQTMRALILCLAIVFGPNSLALAATKPAVVKSIYIDSDVNWAGNPCDSPLRAAKAGFNVIILAFYLRTAGPADMLTAWSNSMYWTQGSAATCAAQLHGLGAVIMFAAGGATDNPYPWSGDPTTDGTVYGTALAKFAVAHSLDGVDFDLENIQPGFNAGGLKGEDLVKWMVAANIAVKSINSSLLVSHAPQAPYFGPVGGSLWPGTTGGFTSVYAKAPNAIDFFNLQFYNQGHGCYDTYAGLFTSSCSNFPGTALMQIATYGVPLPKLVVGKYVLTSDASNGYMSPEQLHDSFKQAATQFHWNSGVMFWQMHPSTTSALLNTIYAP